eukprot:TRINITY_DN178069_c0_g1_i1.p1 TRINITY_DN178069_c0_g1~~TRINITY_DN178069_c0_g1_i1.p1  ORF type:complete len:581 (-),score=92.38 TRINITY_DN178069_c0_g1_i1:150-1892(-)
MISQKIGKFESFLSVLLFVLGVVWYFILPTACITSGELKTRGTYISENALSSLQLTAQTDQFEVQETTHVMHHFHRLRAEESGNESEWIYSQIKAELGDRMTVSKREYEGLSFVTASVMADHKESFVIAANLSGKDMQPMSDAALMLSIIANFAEHPLWMSHNLIFVLFSDSNRGYSPALEKWIEHQMGLNRNQEPDEMYGVLRNCIVLDFHDGIPGHLIAMLTSGFNGQVPNMDLPSVIERIPPTGNVFVYSDIDNVKDNLLPLSFSYESRLKQQLASTITTALGSSGLHAQFRMHNIDAVTLKAGKSVPSRDPSSDAVKLVRLVINSLRVLFDLEEELHHSQDLYFLTHIQSFVSIGEYIVPLVLVISPLILWIVRVVIQLKIDNPFAGLGYIHFVAIVISMCVCLVLLVTQVKMVVFITPLYWKTVMIFVGIPITSLIWCYLMKKLARRVLPSSSAYAIFMKTTSIIPSFLTAIVAFGCGILNFPLAFLYAIIMVPLLRINLCLSTLFKKIVWISTFLMLFLGIGYYLVYIGFFPSGMSIEGFMMNFIAYGGISYYLILWCCSVLSICVSSIVIKYM